MTSADPAVIARVFQLLGVAQQGKAGVVRVDASSPDGMQELTICAVDSVAWERFLVPALDLAGVEIVRLGR